MIRRDSTIEEILIEEKKLLDLLENPLNNIPFILKDLAQFNLRLAIGNISSGNIRGAKDRFNLAGKVRLYLHENYDKNGYTSSNLFVVNVGLSYAILSNNWKLISRYISYDDDFLKTYSASYFKAIKAVLLNDNCILKEQITLLEKYTQPKKVARHYSGVVNGFKGILQDDKNLVISGIKELLEKHKKQDYFFLVNDKINIDANVFYKLATIKGFSVESYSSLICRDLGPDDELDEYSDYEFMK